MPFLFLVWCNPLVGLDWLWLTTDICNQGADDGRAQSQKFDSRFAPSHWGQQMTLMHRTS